MDGVFGSVAGEFQITDDAEMLLDRIHVRIEAASVDTGVEARDEDLRSARFFEVASFPLMVQGSKERASHQRCTLRGRNVRPVRASAVLRRAWCERDHAV